jgi:hypothetical protein
MINLIIIKDVHNLKSGDTKYDARIETIFNSNIFAIRKYRSQIGGESLYWIVKKTNKARSKLFSSIESQYLMPPDEN